MPCFAGDLPVKNRESDLVLTSHITIRLPRGLHARPSARVAQLARTFDADIQIISDNGEVDAKSMLDILSLALKHNDHITLLARGPQAKEALDRLGALLTAYGD